MSHEWHRGVLTTSSWHGLEDVGAMADAAAMIAAGEASQAWPTAVRFEGLQTASGLKAEARGVVGSYADGHEAVLGAVGGFYRATDPTEWRDLCTAAVAAGAKPTGAFALRGGSRVLATFDVGGNGVRTQLMLADAFDGSMKLTAGTTCIKVVCANTLAMAMHSDGDGMSQLRHTSSLETKVKVLQDAIGKTIATGEKVRATFHAAEQIALTQAAAKAVFDKLFPQGEEGDKRAITKADKARDDARRAMSMDINKVPSAGISLATLWNGATYLVDRTVDGGKRPTRGDSDPLESLMFGARAKRIQEVQGIIEVIMASGEIERMTVTQARSHGVDDRQMARAIIANMLG